MTVQDPERDLDAHVPKCGLPKRGLAIDRRTDRDRRLVERIALGHRVMECLIHGGLSPSFVTLGRTLWALGDPWAGRPMTESVAGQAAKRALDLTDHALNLGRLRQGPVGRQAADQMRQDRGDAALDLLGREPRLGRNLRELARAEDLLHLGRCDRLAGAAADPGLGDIAQPICLHGADELVEAGLIVAGLPTEQAEQSREERAEAPQRIRAGGRTRGARDAAEERAGIAAAEAAQQLLELAESLGRLAQVGPTGLTSLALGRPADLLEQVVHRAPPSIVGLIGATVGPAS